MQLCPTGERAKTNFEKKKKNLFGPTCCSKNEDRFQMWCEGMTGHCQKAEIERPSKLLTDFEAFKNDIILTGRHVHPSNVLSDFVARATVIVLTGECSFTKIRLTVFRNGWPGCSCSYFCFCFCFCSAQLSSAQLCSALLCSALLCSDCGLFAWIVLGFVCLIVR